MSDATSARRLTPVLAGLVVPAAMIALVLRSPIGRHGWVQLLAVGVAAGVGAAIFAQAVPRQPGRGGAIAAFALGSFAALGMYVVAHDCVVAGECF